MKTYGVAEQHLEHDHAASLFFVVSGKKQLKMTMSLFDSDMFVHGPSSRAVLAPNVSSAS